MTSHGAASPFGAGRRIERAGEAVLDRQVAQAVQIRQDNSPGKEGVNGCAKGGRRCGSGRPRWTNGFEAPGRAVKEQRATRRRVARVTAFS